MGKPSLPIDLTSTDDLDSLKIGFLPQSGDLRGNVPNLLVTASGTSAPDEHDFYAEDEES